MRLRAMVAAGLLLALMAPTALAATDVDLTLRSGTTAATVSGPGVSGAAVVCTDTPDDWEDPITNVAWISPWADCDEDRAGGDYTYTVTFALPSNLNDLTNLRLEGRVLADDAVAIRLNGNTIFPEGGNADDLSTFGTTTRSHFVAGTNTLTFVVDNEDDATGLYYAVRVRGTATSTGGDGGDGDDGDGEAVTDKDECKGGGWVDLGYRNQGQCVSSAVSNRGGNKH